jgi:nicotinamidase-related amidase
MTTTNYPSDRTGLLLLDPYNDFLSEGGKLWPLLKEIAEEENLLDHMRQIVGAARAAKIQLFIVPHHRWEPGDYAKWRHPNPSQIASGKRQTFAKGTWGGEWHPDFAPQEGDVIIKEHWAQSGFANTDLDQQLKQHGIENVIVIGLLANTCIESTSRFAMELGYHVTLVKDATAAFNREMMRAAHELNGPTFAHAILTTEELIAALPSPLLASASTVDTGFAERFAEVNGVRLRYITGGKGSPVVLLHGYAETSHMWHPIMPLLAQRHTVIVPDLRGAGGSAKPESGYDKKNMAVDIQLSRDPPEHRAVERLGSPDVTGVQVAEVPCTCFVDDLRADVLLRLPDGEDRARRVREDPHAPGVEDVERLRQRAPAGVRDLRGGVVRTVDGDVGAPHGCRRRSLRLGTHGGDVATVEPGHEVVAGRVRRHLVLELPPEEPAVEPGRGLGVRLRSVDPARDPGRILASLQHNRSSLR